MVAARFNATVTDALLRGALDCLARHGIGRDAVHVVRVAGAFEVPQAAARWLAGSRPDGFRGAVALAAVIRGQTPHFEYICRATTQALMDLALRTGVAMGLGVLTCDTLEQAAARAGGEHGNKGWEAAAAALDLAGAMPAAAGANTDPDQLPTRS